MIAHTHLGEGFDIAYHFNPVIWEMVLNYFAIKCEGSESTSILCTLLVLSRHAPTYCVILVDNDLGLKKKDPPVVKWFFFLASEPSFLRAFFYFFSEPFP